MKRLKNNLINHTITLLGEGVVLVKRISNLLIILLSVILLVGIILSLLLV